MKNNLDQHQIAQNKALALTQIHLGHPIIQEVIDEVEVLETLGPNHIIMVTGPSGVGKTTLTEILLKSLMTRYQPLIQQDPAAIPVLRLEARATSDADFNWKLFYGDILEQLEETHDILPAVNYGVDPSTNRFHRPLGRSRDTAAGLRKQVEEALKARNVKVLMIDEGGHLSNVSEVRMKRQTDTLKSLSNCSGCQIMLFGSYDILAISRLSAQLARRIKEIHFARYRFECPDDRIAFEHFLYKLEQRADGYFAGLLTSNAELLHKNSLGCIGTLMDMIKNLISRSIKDGSITQEHLEKSLLKVGRHSPMLTEILQGEALFEGQEFINTTIH